MFAVRAVGPTPVIQPCSWPTSISGSFNWQDGKHKSKANRVNIRSSCSSHLSAQETRINMEILCFHNIKSKYHPFIFEESLMYISFSLSASPAHVPYIHVKALKHKKTFSDNRKSNIWNLWVCFRVMQFDNFKQFAFGRCWRADWLQLGLLKPSMMIKWIASSLTRRGGAESAKPFDYIELPTGAAFISITRECNENPSSWCPRMHIHHIIERPPAHSPWKRRRSAEGMGRHLHKTNIKPNTSTTTNCHHEGSGQIKR